MTESNPKLRTALLLSLAVNVLLAAALAAGAWRQSHRGGEAGGGPMRMPGPGQIARVLPEADQPVFRELMSTRRGEMRPRIVEARRARRDVRDALLAEPFDAKAFDAAMAEMRLRDGEVIAFAHGLLAEAAGKVSPEGRKAIAKAIERARDRRGRDRRGWREPR
jgi:uncharacterized membrane protein